MKKHDKGKNPRKIDISFRPGSSCLLVLIVAVILIGIGLACLQEGGKMEQFLAVFSCLLPILTGCYFTGNNDDL